MFMLTAPALAYAADVPLPKAAELRERVIENERISAEQKERYLCDVTEESDELTANGSVKRSESKTYERFYLNRREIDRLLAKNGKPLSEGDAKKEQDRVSKEVKKYTDPKQVKKAQDQRERQLEMFLKALRFDNGRRELRAGRSTILYSLTGDPNFKASSIEQRFAKALVGDIAVDEQTGELLDMKVRTEKDVKIGGGLLANLHKGFQLHVRQTRQEDGVWMMALIEGTGDARAGLFFHPRFRFRQRTGSCRLFSVDAKTGNTRQQE
jgi:hypothetical protein